MTELVKKMTKGVSLRQMGRKIGRTLSTRQGEEIRHIRINEDQLAKYTNNAIATGKYNILTFVPYFLFSQFKRAANVFFLVISILQQVPNVSPTGQWTTLGPLMFILSISALREIAEDYRRQRDDDQTNNDITKIFTVNKSDGTITWVKTKWKNVQVGSILRVESGKQFPADLVLLSSSEPNGMAYIETSNLDGETNLKLKQALPVTAEFDFDDELKKLKGDLEAEAPTKHLYEFYGSFKKKGDDQVHPLDQGQLLLRGSQLRNTKWIYGLVIYTGPETKLMKNSRQAPLKQSNVEYSVNYQILYMFFALLGLSIISTIGKFMVSKTICVNWYLDGITDVDKSRNFSDFVPYSDDDDNLCLPLDGSGIISSLMTFLILYNNVVPISLLISIEIVKYVQAIFIGQDDEMCYKGTYAKARTSNLNEELGQISYIFTDKTGTLTENIMEFKKCSVGGRLYSIDDDHQSFKHENGEDLERTEKYYENMKLLKREFIKAAKENVGQDKKMVALFLRMMSVCQTVVPEITDTGETEYQASSPDEAALVKAAANLGYRFMNRTPTTVEIKEVAVNEHGEVEETRCIYKILHVLEFSSARKRMSVIVEDEDDNIFVFCKGADNVIYERLHTIKTNTNEQTGEEGQEDRLRKDTLKHLEQFATVGLRTLVFAWCKLDRKFYEKWKENDFAPASTAINDRDGQLELAYAKVEKDLYLIGASAIEDRLQDQVPETIHMMRQAGIHVWMLTGDKQETAVNIGFSCRLIDHSQELFKLDCDSLENTATLLREYKQNAEGFVKQGKSLALIITGRTMKFVFRANTRADFMYLSLNCKSVICCRVSPSQKADIVKAVKKEVKGAITLAIGDGANDVPMIQSAHIGIGISGQEGLQAANSSDYSIAQFRFLQRLLLVHGAWNYWRLVKCILYSFYKNITLYLIELWFAIYNGWSGQILFDRWAISCYNVLFTFWPPIVIGWFERPCEDKNMLAKPQLYATSQQSSKFNGFVFWKMFLNSIVHSFMIFFLTYACYSDLDWGAGDGFGGPSGGIASETLDPQGHTGGYLYIGNYVYTYVVVTVLFKVSLETSTWTFWNWLAVVGSGVLWLLYVLMFGKFWPSIRVFSPEYMAGQGTQVFKSAVFWLGMILIPFVTIARDLLYKIYRYETADKYTFKHERQQDEERTTFRMFFSKTKENIEHMALIKRNRTIASTDSPPDIPEPATATITTGKKKVSCRGYAFSQQDGNQEKIIRADRSKRKPKKKSSEQILQATTS